MIIDEIDDAMFNDIVDYHNQTKAANLKVIGLTATAFDGNEEGNEVKAIDLMKYKLYYNTEKDSEITPIINETKHIETAYEYDKIIKVKSQIQPVLIYANGALWSALGELKEVEVVTKDTPNERLNNMDMKIRDTYPVMMINSNYGTRGLNFRAPNAPQGICMLIGGSFVDRRSRI